MEKRIKNLEQLRELAKEVDGVECYIQLNFGLRSSKQISYNGGDELWTVYNENDDSEQTCTDETLETDTNIIEALDKGALYMY